MRESRTYGSVRGALSNERPYRDRSAGMVIVPRLAPYSTLLRLRHRIIFSGRRPEWVIRDGSPRPHDSKALKADPAAPVRGRAAGSAFLRVASRRPCCLRVPTPEAPIVGRLGQVCGGAAFHLPRPPRRLALAG
jgi:hypothetical protein